MHEYSSILENIDTFQKADISSEFSQVETMFYQGDFNSAKEKIEKLESIYPEDEEITVLIQLIRSHIFIELGNYDDGLELIEKALECEEQRPRNPVVILCFLLAKIRIFIDLGKLESLLTKDSVVTSIMYANNEIGTIEPIKKISEIVHEKGMYLHVDATAAAGRIPLDVQNDGIDLLTLSSNDLYGPQGAGSLYIKPGVKLQPFIVGGGQERGLRSVSSAASGNGRSVERGGSSRAF